MSSADIQKSATGITFSIISLLLNLCCNGNDTYYVTTS